MWSSASELPPVNNRDSQLSVKIKQPRATEPASRLTCFTTFADVSPGGDVCASATDIRPGETSPAARNEERGLFSQASVTGAAILVHNQPSPLFLGLYFPSSYFQEPN